MSRLLRTWLGIGADPSDDADLQLRKVLLLSGAAMVTLAALVWGSIYWAFGERPRR
jgi:hypothetical protein